MTTDFRIYLVTWNVGEVGPATDFTTLLSLDSKILPNIYAVGLQELKTSVTSIVKDSLFDDPWTLALTECLAARDYVRVDSLRLVGTHLAVFVRRSDLPYVMNIESNFTRTGLRGYWGSKGAVSVRMDVHGVSVCIVNAHFTAHQENYPQRILDYSAVIEQQRFSAKQTPTILDHDYVFFIGDLNFRIDGQIDEVKKLIAARDFKSLWDFEQLNKARKDKLILLDFEEGPLNFAPTFKYDVGTHVYDTSAKNRIPSWCDRVFWHVHKDAYTNIELAAQLVRYTSLDDYMISDHKPVIAELTMQVLSHSVPLPVLFEPLGQWSVYSDNSVSYTIAADFAVTSRDWIGLYKSSYKHFRDHATYVWASTTGTDVNDGTFMYTVKFEETYLRTLTPGDYYLIYHSAQKRQVIGISDILQLSISDESSSSGSDNEQDDDNDDDVTGEDLSDEDVTDKRPAAGVTDEKLVDVTDDKESSTSDPSTLKSEL